MPQLLDATDLQVHPDYHMFGIGDTDPFGDGGPAVPAPGWLGVGRAAVLVGAGEQLVYPNVRLELWDGAPPAPTDHEVQETIRLHLPTGQLNLTEITAGGQADIFKVPPGVYSVRITGWERESTRAAYEMLANQDLAWDDPTYETLHGKERYLFQFWLEEPTACLLETSGVNVHTGYPRIGITTRSLQPSVRLPAAGPEDVEVTPDCLLIKIGHPDGRSLLLLQRWSDEPPEPGHAHRRLGTFQVSVGKRSRGYLRLLQVPLEESGRDEIYGGMLPLGFEPPPGDYNVRVTAWRLPEAGHGGHDRYLAQFWDE